MVGNMIKGMVENNNMNGFVNNMNCHSVGPTGSGMNNNMSYNNMGFVSTSVSALGNLENGLCDDLWLGFDESAFNPASRSNTSTPTANTPTPGEKDTATSEYFKLPPQSRLRQVVLKSVEHSWIKCCEENNVCVDQIFGSCNYSACPMVHVQGFKKEHLFYRTERCREGERCSHKKTNCRFWHPEGTEPRRTAQENILFALRRHKDAINNQTTATSATTTTTITNTPNTKTPNQSPTTINRHNNNNGINNENINTMNNFTPVKTVPQHFNSQHYNATPSATPSPNPRPQFAYNHNRNHPLIHHPFASYGPKRQ